MGIIGLSLEWVEPILIALLEFLRWALGGSIRPRPYVYTCEHRTWSVYKREPQTCQHTAVTWNQCQENAHWLWGPSFLSGPSIQHWPIKASAQLRLGTAGAFMSAIWTRLQSEVWHSCYSECIICLLYVLTITLDSRWCTMACQLHPAFLWNRVCFASIPGQPSVYMLFCAQLRNFC